jgi:hypothetical protein
MPNFNQTECRNACIDGQGTALAVQSDNRASSRAVSCAQEAKIAILIEKNCRKHKNLPITLKSYTFVPTTNQ